MKKKSFIIIFDIPNTKRSLARKVQRQLNKKAVMVQKSVWKSKNLNDLIPIASTIKQEGAQVTILKEEIITI